MTPKLTPEEEKAYREKANWFIQGCIEEKIGDESDWKAMKFAFDGIESFLAQIASERESALKKRIREEIKNTPIEKAHTYSSENADEYRIYDAGQENYKRIIISIPSLQDKESENK